MSQILSQSDWYEIRAADESAAIDLYGDIGADWQAETLAAAGFVKAVAGISAKTIDVRINSYGGSVYDGLAIYNALRSHGAKIRTFNEGIAASIASLIYMAGDERVMAENAQLMIHAPWTIALGNANELRDMADTLDRVSKSMASSYASSGMDKGEILALLMDGKDHWYSADEAKEAGFATEVTERSAVAAKYQSNRFVNRGTRHEVSKGVDMTDKAAGQTTTQDPKPTQPVTPVAAAPEQKPYARSTAESQQLIALFKAHLGKPGIDDLKDSVLADSSVSPEAAGLQILAALGRDQSPARAPGIETVEDTTDKFRAAAADAILAQTTEGAAAKANLQGNPYAGMRPSQIARVCMERNGIKVMAHDPDGIFRQMRGSAMFTQGTGDFPVILENVMHKVLRENYKAQEDTWSRFCAVSSASDFRPHNRYRGGSIANLDQVNEHGEFINKAIPDGEKTTVSTETKGNIINITRQALVNDDMGYFVSLAALFGRAAKRTIEDEVYALLNMNSGNGPTMADGNPFFHASRGNIATGAVPSMAVLKAMRIQMLSQKDKDGNEWLDFRPDLSLSGFSVADDIRAVLEAQYDPDVVQKFQRPNVVRGMLRDIVETPRLASANAFYLFADKNIAAPVDVTFLNGVQEPFLDYEAGFDIDGFRWKVRLDVKANPGDPRGAIRNPGA